MKKGVPIYKEGYAFKWVSSKDEEVLAIAVNTERGNFCLFGAKEIIQFPTRSFYLL